MMILKVTQNTQFKISTADSSALTPTQLIDIPSGTSFEINLYLDAGNAHYWVTFPAILGLRDNWYMYQGHVEIRPIDLDDDRIDRGSERLKEVEPLSKFLATLGQLSLADRQLLVEQALVMLDQAYVHLPHKKAMHAIDPIQQLRLLQHRLSEMSAEQMPHEIQFHKEMIEIFTSTRDLHTNYLLPAPFNHKTAFLPFQVEEYFDNGTPKYLVSKLLQGFTHATFQPGVEVLSWNGIPIAQAIEINADRQAGSNLAARHARGLEALTIRPLLRSLPPDEAWVMIGYRTEEEDLEIRQYWRIFSPNAEADGVNPDVVTAEATALGIDVQTDTVRQAKQVLFAPQVAADAEKMVAVTDPADVAGLELDSVMPRVFRAQAVETPGGTFGYIRIFTFSVRNASSFVNEFVRLAELLPQNGLIIDVRGNGGGLIWAGEQLLQVLTPRSIQPERVQFINTPLNLELTRLHSGASRQFRDLDLTPWLESMAQAIQTGATYSLSFPITPVDAANAIGQKYHGPVVLITDALCYSTTDIFAAGFQDHEIGAILGTSQNTGAGGANVWTHSLLQALLQTLPDSPFESLTHGAGMRVSVRRTLRAGDRAGTPVEDLGVEPDERYYMTKNDLLNGNVDLINRAGSMLAQMPVRVLEIEIKARSSDTLEATVTTQNFSRLDVLLDGRPQQSLDVGDGSTNLILTLPMSGASTLEMQGFESSHLVAARRISI
ncbi:MAG: peptidase S41 [Cyanothece sp. SIO1E1]|nr:peptidase S41 [Cyanothece sp. SIO1E1]